jgi:hypothetical protein
MLSDSFGLMIAVDRRGRKALTQPPHKRADMAHCNAPPPDLRTLAHHEQSVNLPFRSV